MTWIVGIDEAGYGPNLGPFVMASAACRVPDEHARGDLWQLLKACARRRPGKDDGRVLVEDSKVVYSSKKGLKALERGTLGCTPPPAVGGAAADSGGAAFALRHWVEFLSRTAHTTLRDEAWYLGETPLPAAAGADELAGVRDSWHRAAADAGVTWGQAHAVIVCAPRFNALVDRWGTKSIVLMLSLAELLRSNLHPDQGTDPVLVHADKHGGRDHYASVLQQAIPEAMVTVREEGRDCSVYELRGLRRECTVRFQPRADAEYFCVALASMLAKYTRELLMLEFNSFWQTHLPGLKPTAGYPVDAARYMEQIAPVAARLGIPEAAVWRQR